MPAEFAGVSAVRTFDLLAEYRLWQRYPPYSEERVRAANRFLDKWSKAPLGVRALAAVRLVVEVC